MPTSERYRQSVATLFSPSSVAIVGASQAGTGRTVVENFEAVGYSGRVICVNPKYDEVAGVPCVATLDDIPFVPDAVLLSVGRDRVVPMLEAAAAKGIRGAVIFAFGFAETDDTGRALQRRLSEVAQASEMAIVGPNCQGLVNFVAPAPLYMDSVQAYEAGRVALLAESGSVVTALINNHRGVRWSHAVSSGNEAVTDAADALHYFVDSPDVDVISCYLETIRRPDAFFAACDRAAAASKPIVVCKSGRTAEAQAAAAAHSGALALPQRLVSAALKRHGVVAVESLEELLEATTAMQSRRRPKGGRLGVLTASGGQIELVHDNVVGTGLSIPAFAAHTVEALTHILAPFLPARNPLDWWGTADADESVPAILRTVAADPEIDIVVQVGDFTVGPTGDEPRAAGSVAAARKVLDECDELFVVLDGIGGAPPARAVEGALEEGMLVLSGFDSGLRALGHLVRVASGVTPARRATPVPSLREEWGTFAGAVSSGPAALSLLEKAGFDVVARRLVRTIDDALAAASTLGYPVVAKVASSEIAHKTEIGGVIVGIASPAELETAMKQLWTVSTGDILIEEQISGGVEMFLGIESRPPLGTFVLVGLGGIWTELVDDVQIASAGLRAGEAGEMVRSLRGFERLMGARGQDAVDVARIVEAVERLDDVALELGSDLGSLDVNPLIALKDRAVVVDALLVPGAKGES